MSKFLPKEYMIIAEQGILESLFDPKMKTRTEQNFVRYYEAKNKCIMTDRIVLSKDDTRAVVQYEFTHSNGTTEKFQVSFSTSVKIIVDFDHWVVDNTGFIMLIIVLFIIWLVS